MIRILKYSLLLIPAVLLGCGKASAPAPQPQVQKHAIDPSTTADVTGVVSFQGTPPPASAIDITSDPACAFTAKRKLTSETVVVSNGHLQNVFVYVKDGLGQYVAPKASAPVILDQIGCRYEPHVLGVMVGQPLRIVNSDKSMHNVHAMAQENPPWNLSQMPGAAPIERSFDQPELLMALVCNQHPWMKMYVNVVDNPFFAVSDAQGRFSISGLPPGDYTIEAIHEFLGTQEAKIHLNPHEQKNVAFNFRQQH